VNAFRHALTPARALLLAALLLLAQAAGLAHRVAHGGLPVVAQQAAAGATGDGFGWHSQAGGECRLFDQLLGHGDSLPASMPLVLASGVDVAPVVAPITAARCARLASYRARAPPADASHTG
jgi:hypothetical protein